MFWCSLPLLFAQSLPKFPYPKSSLFSFLDVSLCLSCFYQFPYPLKLSFHNLCLAMAATVWGETWAWPTALQALTHSSMDSPRSPHFLHWEHQRNRETPPTSAAHQYLLIQKSTLWERTPGSCSSSGWLLIMNDSPRVKDVLMDSFCFAPLFLTVPTSLGHGDDWCNKPKMWLFKLEDWPPVIIIKEKYTTLRSFLIDFFPKHVKLLH